MPTFGAGETVTLISNALGPEDSYGNQTWLPTETDCPGCAVWPMDSNGSGGNEQTDARDMVIWGYTVVFPVGTVVRPTDRVRLRGDTFEVTGEPGVFHSPFTGSNIGPQVALKRVTG